MKTTKIGSERVLDVLPLKYAIAYPPATAARLLGVSVTTIERWVNAGQLYGTRWGGRLEIAHLDLWEFCACHAAFWPVVQSLDRAKEAAARRFGACNFTRPSYSPKETAALIGASPKFLENVRRLGLRPTRGKYRHDAIVSFLESRPAYAPALKRFRLNLEAEGTF